MTALADTTDRLIHIAPDDLRPHPANRKRFDQAKLQELADNIAKVGVLTPLLVRRIPDPKGPSYQIIAGDRRCRAAKLAKLATVPCLVREISDVEALEFLIVENLHREDVHALEEAHGYAELIKVHRFDVPTIAAKVGKSTKYVYDRMKLLQLSRALQTLFLEDRFSAGHAILLARLTKDDQARCLGMASEHYGDGGLFQAERLSNLLPGMESDEDEPLKPVSVRELESWIDKNVRFDADKADAFLFPETVQAVRAAKEEEEKVVHITHDYYVTPDARDDKTRTIGPRSWKRADGEDGSKTCDYAVTGVVVVGAQRGESLKVCIDKKKCAVHWKQERAHANRRARLESAAATGGESQQEKLERERQREKEKREKAEAEQRRWLKARPQLVAAVVERLKKASAGPESKAADLAMAENRHYGDSDKQLADLLGKAKTAEDLIRRLALRSVLRTLRSDWAMVEQAPRLLGAFGIDARKIVDAVSPPEKVQTAAKTNTKKVPAKKTAAKKGGR